MAIRKQVSRILQRTRITRVAAIAVVTLAALAVGPAGATTDPVMATTPDISRDAATLRDHVHPRPVDRDVVDTAIILTNLGNGSARALCVGFDASGEAIGRTRIRIAALGLRYFLASDLASNADFVGSVHCTVRGHVAGSAVLLGAAVTNLNVVQTNHSGVFRIRFPVVATY